MKLYDLINRLRDLEEKYGSNIEVKVSDDFDNSQGYIKDVNIDEYNDKFYPYEIKIII